MAAAAAIVGVWWWLSRDSASAPPTPEVDMSLVAAPVKPKVAPLVGEDRAQAPMPEMPAPDLDDLRAVYDQALAEGKRPGDAAFRRMIAKFMEYNAEFARAKAVKEGLTLAEIEELTYFGFLVMATQQPTEIEDLIGRTLAEDEREQLGQLAEARNQEFSEAMHALVERGAPASERWALIAATESGYRADLFALTGLDDETLDDLLAGDISRTGAPANAEYPDVVVPQPYVPDEQRPEVGTPPAISP